MRIKTYVKYMEFQREIIKTQLTLSAVLLEFRSCLIIQDDKFSFKTRYALLVRI